MRWYALRTAQALGFRRIDPAADAAPEARPRIERRFGEFEAVHRLRDNGYDAFAPSQTVRVRAWPRHTRRWVMQQEPVWRGYCFAAFPGGVPWHRLAAWSEVIDVVRMGGEPYVIPEPQIAALRAVIDVLAEDGAPRDKGGRPIRKGASVEMHRSAWLGALGVVEAVHRENVIVLMQFLGAPRRVAVAADELELVG